MHLSLFYCKMGLIHRLAPLSLSMRIEGLKYMKACGLATGIQQALPSWRSKG